MGESNRLANETSPYLRQHAHNPVDWYPWGDEALQRARDEDRPIFLSIGYAACHWCHVMERESFENPEIARLLNESFVSIKVDREERPDLDELYMTAVQLLTGSGGWPMSVWLTPDLRPFYGGTYFPPEDRWGRPGFAAVLAELARAYRDRRQEVERAAGQLAEALRDADVVRGGPGAALDREPIDGAVASLRRRFDSRYGGFGPAPKFPPSAGLALLLRLYRQEGDHERLKMVTCTLDGMARGGMFDHVGGGFHRYSTDAQWLVPHFEKMLYDNALLVPVYLEAYDITGDEEYRRVAEETLAWVRREMTHPDGGFYSSLDADSEGEEGRFYVWTPDEVVAVLGADNGALFNRVYGVTPQGSFEGRSIPHLRRPVAKAAEEMGVDADDLHARLAGMRARLYEARAARAWPAKDDKILTSWNGMMISAFSRAGLALQEPEYIAAAERAAGFILSALRPEGRLLHTFRDGTARIPAFQDDYAWLAQGLLDLYEATGEEHWREEGRALVARMNELFLDREAGGYFFTAADQETPITRGKHPYDGATPSGNSTAVNVLLDLVESGCDPGMCALAAKTLAAFRPAMVRSPDAFHNMEVALDRWLDLAGEGALAGVVHVEAHAVDGAARPGSVVPIVVKLRVEPGWHVNAHETAGGYMLPTTVELAPGPGLSAGEVRYPPALRRQPPGMPETLLVYEGDVEVSAEVRVSPDVAPGETQVGVRVRVQPCDDRRCLAPEEREVVVGVTVVP